MIEYDAKNWAKIIFRWRGSVLPRLLPRSLVGGAIGALATWTHVNTGLRLAPIAHTMLGAALGLLLVLRTNASYDRYWEGRRLLGVIVSRSRDLARQIAAWLPREEGARKEIGRLICAYFWAVAQSLRDEDDDGSLARLLPEGIADRVWASRMRPLAILIEISKTIESLIHKGALHPNHLLSIENNLTAMHESFVGCERIRRTPVPFAYAQHIKVFVILFAYSAPFAMADAMGWLNPLASFFLCVALFGIDEIGVEIEDPFGRDPNDLPIDALGRRLEGIVLDTL
ncbi:MAG: bestrophin family protein [Sandaracinaceae bacterium]|nr:bestrophin family protein [Sandaracinaceae bacterium]